MLVWSSALDPIQTIDGGRIHHGVVDAKEQTQQREGVQRTVPLLDSLHRYRLEMFGVTMFHSLVTIVVLSSQGSNDTSQKVGCIPTAVENISASVFFMIQDSTMLHSACNVTVSIRSSQHVPVPPSSNLAANEAAA